MATNHRLWTRDELIIAFNLYCKIPFGQIDARNPVVNLLHHKAFDAGLITITPEFRVRVSASLATSIASDSNKIFFTQYDNQLAQLPRRFLPDPSLLEWHNQTIFIP